MDLKTLLFEFVDLVKIYRDGRENRERMPRWLAELFIECISLEEPDVARARIEPIHVDGKASYPIKPVSLERTHRIALQMAAFLPTVLAA